jgi:hypothetical protein
VIERDPRSGSQHREKSIETTLDPDVAPSTTVKSAPPRELPAVLLFGQDAFAAATTRARSKDAQRAVLDVARSCSRRVGRFAVSKELSSDASALFKRQLLQRTDYVGESLEHPLG